MTAKMQTFLRVFGPMGRGGKPLLAPVRAPLDVSASEWRTLRAAVFERDNYTCVYCGATPGLRDLQADHVIARSRGGKSTLKNLAAACRPCNGSKWATPVDSWRKRT